MSCRLGGKLLLHASGWIAACPGIAWGQATAGQPQPMPEWQAAAGGRMAFEVASVKPDAGPFRPPNFPLDSGDAFRPVGGRFFADFGLPTYIAFAYKLWLTADQREAMIARLPKWVSTERYAIEARAPGNPTKDQMRLMMQSLLQDRFKLALHFETQVVPVLAMALAKEGKTGPNLRPHSEGIPCEKTPAASGPPPADGVFPPYCDVYMLMMRPNAAARAGSRNTTLDLLANSLPGLGNLERPVVDRTGLSGRFDFTLEWVPERRTPSSPNADAPADPPGPTFLEALREQLGLKLESTRAPLRIPVVDHVELPSAN